ARACSQSTRGAASIRAPATRGRGTIPIAGPSWPPTPDVERSSPANPRTQPGATMSALTPDLDALLATRQDGHGMPRAFYHTDALYAYELERIWRAGWLFAGFVFEIPKPGDYITLAVGDTPILVMRDDAGKVRALHNVCRHRGTRVCRSDSGHVRSIVCPYHSWTYSRQGELVACQGMHEGIDKSTLGLRSVATEVCAGLIYVSLAATPPAFAPM